MTLKLKVCLLLGILITIFIPYKYGFRSKLQATEAYFMAIKYKVFSMFSTVMKYMQS